MRETWRSNGRRTKGKIREDGRIFRSLLEGTSGRSRDVGRFFEGLCRPGSVGVLCVISGGKAGGRGGGGTDGKCFIKVCTYLSKFVFAYVIFSS